MELDEYPLLHEADLMLRLLRLGLRSPATLERALRHLKGDLRLAREHPDASDEALLDRLAAARDRLAIAALIEPDDRGRFRTTDRGAWTLLEHPMGVDESVLATIPEYRAYLDEASRRPALSLELDETAELDDPCVAVYAQGYAAFQAGRSLEENPHETDSVRHLAWENGWTQARDEAFEKELER
jgi:ribosome modulation factor